MPSNDTENIYATQYGGTGEQIPATKISYDNDTSGLTADDIQEAVDELASAIDTAETAISGLEDDIETIGTFTRENIPAPSEAGAFQFCIKDNIVQLCINVWTDITGFTIPAKYRPAVDVSSVAEQKATSAGEVTINRIKFLTDGSITLSDSNVFCVGEWMWFVPKE